MKIKAYYMLLLGFFIVSNSLFPIYSASLIWDPAGTNGILNRLNVGIADSNTTPSYYDTYYEHYNLDGFIGRFIYQGEEGVVLTFNAEPPYASGQSSSYFYYTRVGDTSRYRRVFLVTTVKGELHSGAEGGILLTHNPIIDNPGDTITIPKGAGSETITEPSSPTNLAYNSSAQLGYGPTYIYRYPYEYLWIDITVIRDTENSMRNAEYTCGISITGEGIFNQLLLSGYRGNTVYVGPSYLFSVERIAPDYIPFSTLISYTSTSNSFPVGSVRYQSADSTATISFHSDSAGSAVDFIFKDAQNRTFPYSVVFDSQVPNLSPVKVDATHNSFSTTNTTFTSPTHGETASQKSLQGDVSIYLASGLTPTSYIAGNYSSIIYVFVNAN